ncbi:MAG: c-type cytochrome [Myxococcales bacterium]|nr:c-type cytochrome [Myxococcales bacterium]
MNTPRAKLTALVVLLGALAARCAPSIDRDPLDDPTISRSRFNAFRCTTCHAIGAGDPRILPGARLDGALARRSFWGGAIATARGAVDECFAHFMRGDSLDREPDAEARLLRRLSELRAVSGALTDTVPFTVVSETAPPTGGDRARGRDLYDRACGYCHGAPHTGEGRVGATTSVLPEDTERSHPSASGYTIETLRHTFVHKVRLGSFRGFAGTMPPFSREVLSDEDVVDIVAYLDPTLR